MVTLRLDLFTLLPEILIFFKEKNLSSQTENVDQRPEILKYGEQILWALKLPQIPAFREFLGHSKEITGRLPKLRRQSS